MNVYITKGNRNDEDVFVKMGVNLKDLVDN